MLNTIVDAHTHIQEIKNFFPDPDVIPVICGYSYNSNIRAVELTKKLSLPLVLGIAPQTSLKEGISKLDEWIDFIRRNKPNAIGEIGLDFHWARTIKDKETERYLFFKMLDLSDEMKLPIVIHSRDATAEIITILKEQNFLDKTMFHFFSGTLKEAEEVISFGSILSFTPLHSKERKSIIKSIALDNVVVETDAPFVCREPKEVIKAIEYIAEIKNVDIDIVKEQTRKNAAHFFNIFNIK